MGKPLRIARAGRLGARAYASTPVPTAVGMDPSGRTEVGSVWVSPHRIRLAVPNVDPFSRPGVDPAEAPAGPSSRRSPDLGIRKQDRPDSPREIPEGHTPVVESLLPDTHRPLGEHTLSRRSRTSPGPSGRAVRMDARACQQPGRNFGDVVLVVPRLDPISVRERSK